MALRALARTRITGLAGRRGRDAPCRSRARSAVGVHRGAGVGRGDVTAKRSHCAARPGFALRAGCLRELQLSRPRLAAIFGHIAGSEPARVIARFAVRVVLLAAFAAFGGVGFGRSLAALLWMSIILCSAVAILRR